VKKSVYILMLMFIVGCIESSPTTEKKIPLKPEIPNEISEDAGFSKESFQPTLDILFVIDDSGSMGSHQKNLADNVKLFADAIVKTTFLDYHVGVITSSAGSQFLGTGGGKLFGNPKYVDRSTPDGLNKLAQNLIVGTSGDATEIFFDPLFLALTNPLLTGYNDGFIREDGYLAVIFVTDTDDQSKNMDAQSTYDFLINLKGSTDKLFVGAAYIPDSEIQTCSGESFEVGNTNNLPDFFKLTKATTFSLCDPDFGEQLAEIGRVLARKSQTMFLKKIPKKGTIKIVVRNQEIPNHPQKGWTYNPVVNAIEFGREIDWSVFPENTFPSVNFEAIEIDQPDLAGETAT
jgi:hypothetical protein